MTSVGVLLQETQFTLHIIICCIVYTDECNFETHWWLNTLLFLLMFPSTQKLIITTNVLDSNLNDEKTNG